MVFSSQQYLKNMFKYTLDSVLIQEILPSILIYIMITKLYML